LKTFVIEGTYRVGDFSRNELK